MKAVKTTIVLIFSLAFFPSAKGNLDPDRELRDRFERMLLSSPGGGINSETWKNAVISQLSQCGNSGGDCKCTLVIAEGIGADSSANLWIGTLSRGETTTLWEGKASRNSGSGFNSGNSNMPLGSCRENLGDSSLTDKSTCLPELGCRDVTLYRGLADGVGTSPSETTTIHHYSTALQNGNHFFHDFYPCDSEPCPATQGGLGLDRGVMKQLCSQHINGTGAWLYFENTSSPGPLGSQESAFEGYKNMVKGNTCSNVSMASLSGGSFSTSDQAIAMDDFDPPSDYVNSSEGIHNEVQRRSSYREPSSSGSSGGMGSGYGGSDYNDASNDPYSEQSQANQQGQGEDGGGPELQIPIPPKGKDEDQEEKERKQREEEIRKKNEDAVTQHIIKSCETTTFHVCAQVSANIIKAYCANPRLFKRSSCIFEKIDSEIYDQ